MTVCFDVLPFAFHSYFPSKNQCYVWWFFWKTHIMCHQINSTKEEGRNSHEESTEIIFMCLSSPLQETLFSSCVLFFPIISNLHPSVQKWLGGLTEAVPPTATIVVVMEGACSCSSSRPAASTGCFGTWDFLSTQLDCVSPWAHLHDAFWNGYTTLKAGYRLPVPYHLPQKLVISVSLSKWCTFYHVPGMGRERVHSQKYICVCSPWGNSALLHP